MSYSSTPSVFSVITHNNVRYSGTDPQQLPDNQIRLMAGWRNFLIIFLTLIKQELMELKTENQSLHQHISHLVNNNLSTLFSTEVISKTCDSPNLKQYWFDFQLFSSWTTDERILWPFSSKSVPKSTSRPRTKFRTRSKPLRSSISRFSRFFHSLPSLLTNSGYVPYYAQQKGGQGPPAQDQDAWPDQGSEGKKPDVKPKFFFLNFKATNEPFLASTDGLLSWISRLSSVCSLQSLS